MTTPPIEPTTETTAGSTGTGSPSDARSFEGRLRTSAVLSLLVALFGTGVLAAYTVDQVRGQATGQITDITAGATSVGGDSPSPASAPGPSRDRGDDACCTDDEPLRARLQALAAEHAQTDAALQRARSNVERLRATRDALQSGLAAALSREQTAAATHTQAATARARGASAAPLHAYAALGACITEQGLRISLGSEDLRFPVGTAELPPAAEDILEPVAGLLAQAPGQQVAVIGHTDASGDTARNQRLSEERAAAVRATLIALGVAPERIRAKGRGESAPVADNATAAGRRANRRVELMLSGPIPTD